MALVSSILDKYTHLIHEYGVDPRVKNWLFIENPFPLIIVIATYLYITKVGGPKYMQNRKPYDLSTIIRIYNIFQVLSCALIIYSILYSGWIQRKLSLGCQPVEVSYDPHPMKLASLMWWTMILKMSEFAETIFFVLRKKYNQVSFLHLYHHVSTLIFAWIGAGFVPGGMATFPVMLNCGVHIFMYTYYFLANMGPDVQKYTNKVKPYITAIQMIQFTILLFHSLPALNPNCKVPKILAYLYIPNIILVYYLFYDFYNRTYSSKKKSKM